MNSPTAIGNIVLIHDPRLADQLSRRDEPGVVLQRRRGGARVGFLSDGGNAWVEDARLLPHPSERPGSALLRVVAGALDQLRAEEAWFEEREDDRLELHARCLGFDEGELASVRAAVGKALKSWSVIPYGMAAVTVVLRLSDSEL